MSYDPQKVGLYGNLAEKWAAERYPVTLDYPMVSGLKFDATSDDGGEPWDIKASMTNGVRPTFKFWEDQHATLRDAGGGYILVWYRALETEIQVRHSRALRSEQIRISNWTNPGAAHHRSHTREAQLPADHLRGQLRD